MTILQIDEQVVKGYVVTHHVEVDPIVTYDDLIAIQDAAIAELLEESDAA